MITLIGLGPADTGSLTLAARDALRAASLLLIRTANHPAVGQLAAEGILFESLDYLYESGETFDGVYDSITALVLEKARSGDVAYAVPGHPLVAEESVRRLILRAKSEGIPVRIVGSASFLEPTMAALNLSLGDGLQLLDALTLGSDESHRPNVAFGLLLFQVYDQATASAVKLVLMRDYPDDWVVSVVTSAGVTGVTGETGAERVESTPLHLLDRIAVTHLTSVYVPPLPSSHRPKRFADLVWVMARLRGEGGCPWDREQDHSTLKRYMIEECYEAIEAIDEGDVDALAEELGDVLLQVVFHAQLEAEAGTFDIEDVIRIIVEKLIRRHPHVFGDALVADSAEVLRNWEEIKRTEKPEGWRESVLDGVPAGLPALMRALEISKRAAKSGFEWERFEDVVSKMEEETRELEQAISTGDRDEIASELGDLLFTLVNIARWQKVDAEDALRRMLARFTDRFHYIERRAREQGRDIESMTLAEMDAFWNEAKRTGR